MSAQTETTGKKFGWAAVNIVVLLYAFIPVVWIISLSLKGHDTLNDGKYLPAEPDDRGLLERSSRTTTSCGR